MIYYQERMTEVIKPQDVDDTNKIYNMLKMKSNCLTEIIEYVDKTLIQVYIVLFHFILDFRGICLQYIKSINFIL